MSLETKINEQIKEAMRSKNVRSLASLRSIKNAILVAKSEKGQEIDEAKEIMLLKKLVKQRQDSLEIYTQAGRTDLASVEKEELEVIESFLPSQLSDDKIIVTIYEVMEEFSISAPKDAGRLMGLVTQKLNGLADNKVVFNLIKSILV